MFPCSQSTMIQSGLALAKALETFAPGSICQIPRLGPLFSLRTVRSLLDLCIAVVAAMVDDSRKDDFVGNRFGSLNRGRAKGR